MDFLTYAGIIGLVSMGDLAAKIQADWAEIGVKVNVKQQAGRTALGTDLGVEDVRLAKAQVE